MITVDVLPERVEMRAYGNVSLADCKAFEQLSEQRASRKEALDLLIDLRAMTECSMDATLEEWRFIRAHPNDFRRIAIVTDDQVVTWYAWLSQFFTEADIEVFEGERAARRWLEGEDETPTVPDTETRADLR